MRRSARWWLCAPLLGAALLRALPFLLNGLEGTASDYDEGAYYTAGAALWRGSVPYRDFVHVQPPGAQLLLGWVSLLGSPAATFQATRLLMVVVGTATAGLLAWWAARRWGLMAGLAAAILYASYPEAVAAERGVFTEPLLNLLSVAGVLLWLRDLLPSVQPRRRWWLDLAAGSMIGVGTSVKVWGVFALLACLAAVPRGERRRLVPLLVGFGAALAATVGPFLVLAPGRFAELVVELQARRPRTSSTSALERLSGILAGHIGVTALLVLGAVMLLRRRPVSRTARAAYVWHGALLASFLVSPSFFDRYDAALAPSAAMVAAMVANAVTTGEPSRRLQQAAGFALGAAVLAGVIFDVRTIGADESQAGMARQLVISSVSDGCIYSFDPVWLVDADRLPNTGGVAIMGIDPYAAVLADATSHGRRFTDEADLLAHHGRLPTLDATLASCDQVLLGPRGRAYLGDQLGRFETQFRRVGGDPDGPDLWVRR
jgi:hypothetical protein